MIGFKGDNPRVQLKGTDLERTMNYMALLDDPTISDSSKSLMSLLGDYPLEERNPRGEKGATIKQLCYISSLSGIHGDEGKRMFLAFSLGGGISSSQASYLINKLKEEKANLTL